MNLKAGGLTPELSIVCFMRQNSSPKQALIRWRTKMQPKRDKATETFKRGKIAGVVVRDLKKHLDERGWLAELFRHDELTEEFYPQMGYISQSEPHVQRGPHEHVDQADFFCFIGPSNFKMRLWDNRPDSETYRNVMTLFVGADNPKSVLIPKGVVHAYRNLGHSA